MGGGDLYFLILFEPYCSDFRSFSSIGLSVYLSNCIFICLSACLSVCLPVCLSVYLSERERDRERERERERCLYEALFSFTTGSHYVVTLAITASTNYFT